MDLDDHLPGITAGDADAFARWLAGAESALRESLRSFATRIDTEAVLQEALLRIWQVAPRHQPDGRPNSLFRLGIRISRNLAIDDIRRTRSRPTDPDVLEQAAMNGRALEPTEPDPLLRTVIEACRRALRGKPAEVLAMRIECGGTESDEELASRLRMKLNTFLQNFTRARKALAECLAAHHVNLEQELR